MPDTHAGPPSPPTPPPTPRDRLSPSDLFDQAADLPPNERAAFLDDRCRGDPALRREVESLLRYADTDDGELLNRTRRFIPSAPAIPDRIGHYAIIRVIGEGGMGVVYEAVQEQPRRTVALKVLRSPLASPHLIRRFEHEAEVLGQLKHPGIAQIYEAGSVETAFGRQPFFAMELINGLPLNRYAAARRLSARERLELVALICDAFHHAHQKGVIHRDPKPANILVTDDGRPKILDFGVARATDADVRTVTRTEAGQLIGTLPYMSPEQVSGDPTNLDTRSDVYALGVILYELLSGHLPYDLGGSIADGARIIREQEARSLTSFDASFRGDIATIVGKALQKEKERRYQSAAELAADIRRHLSDEPISARPPTAMYQFRKFARRNRALVGGIAATFVALLAGAIVASVLAVRAIRSEREARLQAYRSGVVAAAGDLLTMNASSARHRLDQIPPEERGWEWRYLRWQSDQSLAEFPEPVHTPAVAPLVYNGREVVVVADDAGLRYWDPEIAGTAGIVRRIALDVRNPTTGEPETVYGPDDVSVAASPDSSMLLVHRRADASAQMVIVMDAAGGRELWRATGAISAPRAPFSNDSRRVVLSMSGQFRLSVRDAATGAEISSIGVDDSDPRDLRYLPGHDRVAVSTWAGTEVFAAGAGRGAVQSKPGATRQSRIAGPFPVLHGISIDRDGTALGEWGSDLVLISLVSGECFDRWQATEASGFPSYALSGDGRLVAIPDPGGAISIWRRPLVVGRPGTTDPAHQALPIDAQRHAELVTTLHGHAGRVLRTVFDPSGQRLISASANSVRIWDAMSPACPRVVTGGLDRGTSQAISPDGSMAATFGWGAIHLWDLPTGRERWVKVAWRRGDPVPGAFSPDGSKLTMAGWDHQIATLDTASANILWRCTDFDAVPTAVAWARDGAGAEALVLGDEQGRLTTRDAQGRVVDAAGPAGHGGGRVLAIASDLKHPRIAASWAGDEHAGPQSSLISAWNVAPLKQVAVFRGDPSDGAPAPKALAFSPDGRLLAAGFASGTIAVWDADSGRLLGRTARGVSVYGVAFSPSGDRLLSCDADGSIRIYACPSLDEALLLSARGAMSGVFTPDGGAIMATGHDPIVAFEIAPDPHRTAEISRISEAYRIAISICDRPGANADPIGAIDALGLPSDLHDAVVQTATRHGYQLNFMNSESWGLCRFEGRTPEEYRNAFNCATVCCREWPGVRAFINTLGASQYRVARYDEAIQSLLESDHLNLAAGGKPDPLDYAYIAMAHARLGHSREAEQFLAKTLASAPGAESDFGEAGTVIREAFEVVRGLRP